MNTTESIKIKLKEIMVKCQLVWKINAPKVVLFNKDIIWSTDSL